MALTAFMRLALWTVPVRLLLRFVHWRVDRSLRAAREPTHAPEWIAWAVRIPARRIPHASCLTQALATQLLLARYGHASQLRVGVGRDGQGQFEAHAWVEVGGRTVIGGEIAHRYVPMPDLRVVISDQSSFRTVARVPAVPRS
jgi:hypothetical protein